MRKRQKEMKKFLIWQYGLLTNSIKGRIVLI